MPAASGSLSESRPLSVRPVEPSLEAPGALLSMLRKAVLPTGPVSGRRAGEEGSEESLRWPYEEEGAKGAGSALLRDFPAPLAPAGFPCPCACALTGCG